MKLVALVGIKQSGKSTAAKHLQEKYGFVRHNFKDALIAEIKQNFPDLLRAIDAAEGEGDQSDMKACINNLFDKKPPLIRTLMQNYGTEVRRKGNSHYWVDEWKMGVPDLLANDCTNIVADDCRFFNEALAIRNWGGKIIRIKRTDIATGGNHQSETEQLEIEEDYLIEIEPGDFDGLNRQIDDIMLKL